MSIKDVPFEFLWKKTAINRSLDYKRSDKYFKFVVQKKLINYIKLKIQHNLHNILLQHQIKLERHFVISRHHLVIIC